MRIILISNISVKLFMIIAKFMHFEIITLIFVE